VTEANPEGSTGSKRRPGATWLAAGVLLVALLELALHFRVSGDAIPEADWQGAAALIRSEWRDGDVLVVAPSWISPLVRRAVGASLTAPSVAPGSLESAPRVWAVSARGFVAPRASLKDRPALSKRFGDVHVERLDRSGESPKFDFVASFWQAAVSLERGGVVTPCVLETGAPDGGGLGRGPVRPGRRYECDGKAERWIAPVTVEDLHYQPRYCVREPAFGKAVARIEYGSVPFGEKLVFHAGLYLRDERKRKGAPISLRVLINGNAAGEFVHRDGDGWARYEVKVPAESAQRVGSVAVEVTSPGTKDRNLCWTALSL
jgi:hypothetical protein